MKNFLSLLLAIAFYSSLSAQDYDQAKEAYVTLESTDKFGKICYELSFPQSIRDKFVSLGAEGKANNLPPAWANYFKRTYYFAIKSSEELSYIESLRSLDGVELVEILDLPEILCATDDPSEAPWNSARHTLTNVPEAHCITQGNRDITIAVMDNGYRENHQELESEVIFAKQGVYNGQDHGTGSAITAAGATDNGFGIRSSGYNTTLMLYPISGFANNILDAWSRGARISTNSWGGCSFSVTAQNTINALTEQGMIILAAAGNGNIGTSCSSGGSLRNGYMYPASYDNVISVGGVTSQGCLTNTYNIWGAPYDPPAYHTNNDRVDILAQSFAVLSGLVDPNGGTSVAYGTSISCPQVAGIVALMLSIDPCLTHDDVLTILQSTGTEADQNCPQTLWHPIYPNSAAAPKIVNAEEALLAIGSTAPSTIVVASNESWGGSRLISGIVEVNTGVTLTIEGDVQFGSQGEIRVHHGGILVLDGADLSACNEKWHGIKVEGVSASVDQTIAGKLVLVNNTVIRDAYTAISMHPSYLGWPEYSQHWGGLVEASNSSIYNCDRALEFMKYGVNFRFDRSTFENCSFSNISGSAVTIWENNGVTFEDCNFYAIGIQGIYALNSAINVMGGCSFRAIPTGVKLSSSYPNVFSSKIGTIGYEPNTFCVNQIGVDILGGGILNSMEIVNNEFFGPGIYGVKVDNSVTYRIEQNSFEKLTYGCHFSNTGALLNQQVKGNTFLQNNLAVYSTAQNRGLELVDNCFVENEVYDVININSIVKPIQGTIYNAASNCYRTIHNNPEFLQLFSNQVRYYLPAQGPYDVCFELDNYSGQYPNLLIDYDAGSFTNPNCILPPDFPKPPVCNIEVEKKDIFSNTIRATYVNPNADFDGGLVEEVIQEYIELEDAHDRLIAPLADLSRSEATKAEALEFLVSTDFQNNLQAIQAAIGYAMYVGDLTLADDLLKQFEGQVEQESEEVEDLIWTVAVSSNPELQHKPIDEELILSYDGLNPTQNRPNNTAIFEWATNSHISRDYPSAAVENIANSRQSSTLSIATKDGLDINGVIKLTSLNSALYSYTITDIVGRPILSVSRTNGLMRSDVIDINRGVYVVVCTPLDCEECETTSQVLVVK